jgi:hypothetical protein
MPRHCLPSVEKHQDEFVHAADGVRTGIDAGDETAAGQPAEQSRVTMRI